MQPAVTYAVFAILCNAQQLLTAHSLMSRGQRFESARRLSF
jgi:hypothetical protein